MKRGRSVAQILIENQIKAQETQQFHIPIDVEMRYRNMIRTGDLETWETLRHSSPGDIMSQLAGLLSDDFDENLRYMFVVSVTIARLAAVEGGMDYELSCFLSDAFIQRMCSVTTTPALLQLYFDATYEYCNQVALARNTSHCSSPVQLAALYIRQNLTRPLTLAAVAAECGYSTRYLSSRFRQEMHISLPDYIRQEKLREACNLLTNTNHTISEISTLLAFSSQSHFTELFKAAYGMTPNRYRQRHHQEDN